MSPCPLFLLCVVLDGLPTLRLDGGEAPAWGRGLGRGRGVAGRGLGC